MRYSSPEHFPSPLRKCAQCSADIIAAEWSEHLSDCRVRNVWSCEACGYQFESIVYLTARARADAASTMHIADYMFTGFLIACMLWAGAMTLRKEP
jgi:hypothetical protein